MNDMKIFENHTYVVNSTSCRDLELLTENDAGFKMAQNTFNIKWHAGFLMLWQLNFWFIAWMYLY